jgi:hypothetical protein
VLSSLFPHIVHLPITFLSPAYNPSQVSIDRRMSCLLQLIISVAGYLFGALAIFFPGAQCPQPSKSRPRRGSRQDFVEFQPLQGQVIFRLQGSSQLSLICSLIPLDAFVPSNLLDILDDRLFFSLSPRLGRDVEYTSL